MTVNRRCIIHDIHTKGDTHHQPLYYINRIICVCCRSTQRRCGRPACTTCTAAQRMRTAPKHAVERWIERWRDRRRTPPARPRGPIIIAERSDDRLLLWRPTATRERPTAARSTNTPRIPSETERVACDNDGTVAGQLRSSVVLGLQSLVSGTI